MLNSHYKANGKLTSHTLSGRLLPRYNFCPDFYNSYIHIWYFSFRSAGEERHNPHKVPVGQAAKSIHSKSEGLQ